MLTRNDLQALAQARLDDAKVLYQSSRNSGAYYLCGYVIELALKACIAKHFQADAIPQKNFVLSVYTHNVETLMSLAGLRPQFDIDVKGNAALASAWGIVTKWNEESRYSQWDRIAATALLNCVADTNYGVFEWIKRHW